MNRKIYDTLHPDNQPDVDLYPNIEKRNIPNDTIAYSQLDEDLRSRISRGVIGPQGIQGPRGEQGPQGPVGPQGQTGLQGPRGEQGARGQDGAKGEDGKSFNITGSVTSPELLPSLQSTTLGTAYFVGTDEPRNVYVCVLVNGMKAWQNQGTLQGPEGPVGPQGIQGPAGVQGPVGPEGPVGSQGPQGIQGVQGDRGPQGVAGPEGPQGERGLGLTSDEEAQWVDDEYNKTLNLWDEQWEIGSIDRDTGSNTPSTNTIRSVNYIPIEPNVKYCNAGAGELVITFYNSNFIVVPYAYIDPTDAGVYGNSADATPRKTFTAPNGAIYCRFRTSSAYGTTYNNDLAIVKGTSGTYHKYYGPLLHRADVPDYSFIEVNTHQRWIDGRDIYRMMYYITNVSGASNTWINTGIITPISITNIIKVEALNNSHQPTPIMIDTNNAGDNYSISIMHFRDNYVMGFGTFIIYYVK